ncbi:MAG: M15 family metallopeptidase [Firmicutes bacterium]|nr:M15 family metallopeptidase [Bacillota bacterium]
MKRMIAILLLLGFCLAVCPALAEAEWTFEVPLSLVTGEYATLVNRDHLLDSNFVPGNLVRLNLRKHTSSVVEMDATAADALTSMFEAASKVTEYTYKIEGSGGEWVPAEFSGSDGLKLMLDNGYRTYNSQRSSYYNRLDRLGYDDGYVAPPGASEHQSGLACDVVSATYYNTQSKLNASFYQTPEAQWMEENASSFGFIIRYPQDKEEITQVPYEPWHLRYVGREIAGYIKSRNLTLEEFTDEWQAALEAFESEGGDIQAQLLLESTIVPTAVTTTIMDEYGEDGDPEVSLSMW